MRLELTMESHCHKIRKSPQGEGRARMTLGPELDGPRRLTWRISTCCSPGDGPNYWADRGIKMLRIMVVHLRIDREIDMVAEEKAEASGDSLSRRMRTTAPVALHIGVSNNLEASVCAKIEFCNAWQW